MSPLLDEVLAAHGGLAHWQRLSRLTISAKIGGELWGRRGQEGTLADTHFDVWPHEQRVEFHDLGTTGRTGIYTPARVELLGPNGQSQSRDAPGDHLADQTKTSPWDDLDLVYNAGFDQWHAFLGPFVLVWPDVKFEEIDPWEETGEEWRRLQATFPEELVAHARKATYAFDSLGRLRRFEYEPERPGVPASINYLAGHQWFGGLLVATRRRMVPASEDGMPRHGPTLMAVDVQDIQTA